jgi:hypothetical protein
MKLSWWRYVAVFVVFEIFLLLIEDEHHVRNVVVWTIFAFLWLAVLAIRNHFRQQRAKRTS